MGAERMPHKHGGNRRSATTAVAQPSRRVLAATAAFALLHSALASRPAKAAAAKLLGVHRRNGLYRVLFNGQAAVTSAALLLYVRQLPDRELYVVHGPAAALMRVGQAAGLLLLLTGVNQVGVLRITGASSLTRLLRGEHPPPPEPEGQGPSLDERGALKLGGAFLRSRHPLNLAPLPILWLNPRMTRNLAAFNTIATVYFWVGSCHEERRLQVAYGDVYRAYVNSGVPFFFGARTLSTTRPLKR